MLVTLDVSKLSDGGGGDGGGLGGGGLGEGGGGDGDGDGGDGGGTGGRYEHVRPRPQLLLRAGIGQS